MRKLFLTRRLPAAAMERLQTKFDLTVNHDDRALTREELLRGVRDAEILLPMLTDKVDSELFDAAPKLRGVCNYAVGYNNIDVDCATERGVAVTNTPGVLTDATADLAWALLFAAARRIPEGDRYTRAGKFTEWKPLLMLGVDIFGATLGIIGAGRIGEAMARRSVGFNMKVLYTSNHVNEAIERDLGARRVTLDELLRESDFISLHTPLTPTTQHLMGAAELAKMKPTAVLVNTARGPVVDETALVDALRNGVIRAAGLDVYENEPALAPGLAELDNVALAPHIGSATEATRQRMADMAVDNAIAIANGERPPQLINASVWEDK